MPFDDFIDISIDLSDADLDKLDRLAAKADAKIKKLKKKGGAFSQKGGQALPKGVFSSSEAPIQTDDYGSTLTKADKKFEKRIEKLTKKIEKDIFRQFGKGSKSRGLFGKLVGSEPAGVTKNLFAMGKHPVGYMTNLLKFIPILGGVLTAAAIANFILDEIIKIDRFFKKFIDRVDERIDQLRSAQQRAEIGAGQQQLIVTTRAGSVNARDTYNTYELFNRDRIHLQEQFKIRDTSGVE